MALAYEKKLHTCLGKFSQMSQGNAEEKDPLEDATSFELRSKDAFSDERVTSIKEEHLSASHFEPPANYRKVSFKKFMSTPKDNSHQGHQESFAADQQPSAPDMSREMPSTRPAERQAATGQKKGWMQKDAEDIGEHAANETHDQTKQAVEDQITDTVKKGVKGFMKLFGD